MLDENERNISYLNKIFYKRIRSGSIRKILREKYIRNDLNNGILNGTSLATDKLIDLVNQSTLKHLLVIDTNIALQQIDLLEYQCLDFSLIVITQTLLSEVKHLNQFIYKKLINLINDNKKSYIFYANEQSVNTLIHRIPNETVNDFNDRAIRKTCQYFNSLVNDNGKVILITNDRANKMKSIAEDIESYTIYDYIETYLSQYPELFDLLANSPINKNTLTNNQTIYSSYIPLADLRNNLRIKKFHKGVLRVRSDDWMECYVVVQLSDKAERLSIIIYGKENTNRAVDGDTVVIELLPKVDKINTRNTYEMGADVDNTEAGLNITDGQKLYGKVVGILNRSWKSYAGSIDKNSITNVLSNDSDDIKMILFYPKNNRIPPIYISTKQIDKLIDNRILVTIDSWPENSLYPLGHYIKILGKNGDKDVENLVLLHEYDIPSNDFSPAVLACLPSSGWSITSDRSYQSRVDLRDLPIVSIDPPGCKDIDDALHCILLDNGNYQAGVHIADVTHFVLPDTALDKEASYRSTSTYLVDKRIDMLPSLLSTDLCSLRCNEEHFAFSVIWEITKDFTIVNVEFFKSIINSKASLTYQQAQDVLDKFKNINIYDRGNTKDINQIDLSILLLNHFSKYFHNRRVEQGALTLASPEVKFNLDLENNNPIDISTYQLKESNALVEEWMLLANITVSKKILRHFPTLSVLRRHQPPTRQQFEPLVKAARLQGFDIDISSSKALADSLDEAVIPSDPYFNKLIRILSTRCMMPAQYICSGEIDRDGWYHYGLAAPIYTHFTSPIRRYADVIVHRFLAACIGVIPLPASLADRSKLQDQCTHMNRRHRAAQYVQRASVNLYTLLYFHNRKCIEEAYILLLSNEKINILIPRYGIEGSIDTNTLTNDINNITYNNELSLLSIIVDSEEYVLNVFDKVNVMIQIIENKNGNRQLDIQMVLTNNSVNNNVQSINTVDCNSMDIDDNINEVDNDHEIVDLSIENNILTIENSNRNTSFTTQRKRLILKENKKTNSKRPKLRKYLN